MALLKCSGFVSGVHARAEFRMTGLVAWLLQGEGILFLFTDTQIVDEKMLVYVNDLLASGEIPDLFAQEDKDEIINALRSETKSMGLADSAENCYMVFLQKVHYCF